MAKTFNKKLVSTWWWLLCTSLVLGQVGKGILEHWVGVPLFPHDLLLITGLCWVGWKRLTTKKKTVVNQLNLTHLWVVLLVGIVGSISLGFSTVLGGVGLLSWLYLGRFGCYVLTILAINSLIKQALLPKTTALKGLLTVTTGITVLGLIQLAVLPDLRWLETFGWDAHWYRLTSTVLDPGFTGILLILGWLISIEQKWNEKLVLVISTAHILAIGLTFSRLSWLALVIAVSWLAVRTFIWKRNFMTMLRAIVSVTIGGFLAVMVWLALPNTEGTKLTRTTSIVLRINSIESQTNIEVIDWKTWLGGGWFSQLDLTQDNARLPVSSYQWLFSSVGLIGVGLLGWWVWLNRHGWAKLPVSFQASVLALVVHAVGTATWTYPVVVLVWGSWLTTLDLE